MFTHRDLAPIDDGVTFTAGAGRPRCTPRWPRPRAARTCGWSAAATSPAQFAEHGLLDEIIVSIAPVTLGAGRPLFPRRFDLELVEHLRNGDFLCARYAVSGPM